MFNSVVNSKDMKASTILTKSIHDEFKDVLQALAVLKECFHCRSKKGLNFAKHIQEVCHVHCKSCRNRNQLAK